MSDNRPVLVVTRLEDETSDVVIGELNARGVPVVRLDPGDVMTGDLGVAARFDGSGMTGRLRTPSRGLDLAAVRSVYYRRPSPYAAPPGMSAQDGGFVVDQARFGLGGILASIRGRWVNHPWRTVEAEYKPRQLAMAAVVGFDVPATLITNSLDQAREFASEHPRFVYKPLCVSELTDADGHQTSVWVRTVDAADLDQSVELALHMFQARVDKAADVRTTVIGDQVFSIRIDSPLLDWRENYDLVSYQAIDTPPQVADACMTYLRRFGLLFGAFDFGLARDGSWTWYECNTSGQWHWLEDATDLPMTGALADLLEKT